MMDGGTTENYKPRKPKGNVVNYEDAVKAFEGKIEWSDESMEDCETEGNDGKDTL